MLLIAVALLVRAAIPQGWMIESHAAGGITIAMCNSDMTVTIPFKPGHAPKQQDDGKGEPCAFAGHQSAATPPDGLALPALPLLALAAYDATRAHALSAEGAHYLPPATGPPVTA
ncbi:MAG: hypothetical protein V4647_10960 [Pseudomonadota bacterium]